MRAVVLREVIRGARVDPERLRAGAASRRALAEAGAGRRVPVIGQTFSLERPPTRTPRSSRSARGPAPPPRRDRNGGGRRMTMGS